MHTGIPDISDDNRRSTANLGGPRLGASVTICVRKHAVTFVVLAACLAWLLPGMFGRVPWKPDEAYTVAIINHFYRSHDWLVPMLGGQPFMEKPPLFYWTATGFAWLLHPVLGLNEAARFATLFYMLVTLAGVWLLARELLGTKIARLAPLVLLGCLGIVYRGHELFTDIGLLAGCALAFYGMAISLRRAVLGGVWLGIGTGLGFMCKGLIAPGILGLIFACLPLALREYRSRGWWWTASVASCVALPWLLLWPLLLYWQAQVQFHAWFWDNNLGRFLGWNNMGGTSHDRWYYAKQLPWMLFPAWPLALYALWHERHAWRKPAIVLPAVSALIIVVILQASRSTNDVYALPLFLPIAVLGALGVARLPKPGRQVLYWSAWSLFGVIAILLWWGWFAMLAGHPTWLVVQFDRWIPAGSIHFETWAFALAVSFSAAWLYLGLRAHTSSERALLHWTLGAALAWCLAMSLWLPGLNAAKSYAPVMRNMAAAIPRDYNCIATLGVGDSERGMLDYYAGIPTRASWTLRSLTECDTLLVQSARLTPAKLQGWTLHWQGRRADSRGERFWLLTRDPPHAVLPLASAVRGPYVGRHHERRRRRRVWCQHEQYKKSGNAHHARTVAS